MKASDKQDLFKQGINIDDFPIKESERIVTDVFCTIVGILFSLIIIIVALIVFNGDHYMRTSFPSDSEGRVCGYDLNSHPYIYFTQFPSIKDRVCVQQCPQKGDTRLKCVPTDNIGCQFSDNPNFTVTYYPNKQQQIQIGSFCVPEGQNLRSNLYRDINVEDRYNFFSQITSIITCALISLGLSIIYMVLVQFYPRVMNYVVVIAGLVFMLILAIFTISYPTEHLVAKIILGIVLLILISIVAYGAFKSKYCFDMHGLFLQSSAQLVKENFKILILIPLFLVFLVLFILIVIWQFKSFWSSASIEFNTDVVYYTFRTGSTSFSTFIIFLQCLWGLSFIKQTFNYCVSANAVRWYDEEKMKEEGQWSMFKPFKYILFYNFGSIVAASFMSLIFSLLDYIFDVLRGGKQNRRDKSSSVLGFIDNFFDLVRSDSMAYINISGNPYCNASRYCQILCQRSPISQYSQSISRSYRICSHFLIAGLVSTLSFFLQGTQSSIFIVAIVFTLSLFISTFFISIHADAAEAIQIIFLLDIEFAKKKQQGESNLHNLSLRNPSFARKYIIQTDKIVSKHKERKNLQDK